MPEVGQKAPTFELKDQTGKTHKLSDYKGKWVVLYFYPKDETPGCTKEACSFRDNIGAVQKKNAVVLGVSADDVASHDKFAKKLDLNFPLLADPERKVVEPYGVWVEKSNYGRKYMGIQRATFLIDPHGVIGKVWPKVSLDGHTEEVLAAIP
jgi:peroxiredoxin Q/BCP